MYIIMNVRSTLEIRDARLSFTPKLPGFQQIALVDTDTGELQERRLQHREEAEKFYRDLAAQGMKVRVGMEASGHGGGLNDCSPSCSLSCGLETQPRSVRDKVTGKGR